MKIQILGAINIDLKISAGLNIVAKDSNPASIDLSFGGVAYNIYQNLLNLNKDDDLKLISVISSRGLGKFVKAELQSESIDLIEKDDRQATYVAIMNEDNDLSIGFNDMRILDSLNYNDIKLDYDYLLMDLNLNKELIDKICENKQGAIFVDATAGAKVNKIKDSLSKIDLLKLNLKELEALSFMKLDSEDKILEAIERIGMSTKRVLVSFKDGLYYKDQKQLLKYTHNYKGGVKSTSGAGDALFSAFSFAMMQNYQLDFCLKLALVCALKNVRTDKNVAIYDFETIKNEILNYRIEGELIYEY